MINWRAISGTACLWLLVPEYSLPTHQVNGFGKQGFATKTGEFKFIFIFKYIQDIKFNYNTGMLQSCWTSYGRKTKEQAKGKILGKKLIYTSLIFVYGKPEKLEGDSWCDWKQDPATREQLLVGNDRNGAEGAGYLLPPSDPGFSGSQSQVPADSWIYKCSPTLGVRQEHPKQLSPYIMKWKPQKLQLLWN